jgi:hypothetical protein
VEYASEEQMREHDRRALEASALCRHEDRTAPFVMDGVVNGKYRTDARWSVCRQCGRSFFVGLVIQPGSAQDALGRLRGTWWDR